MQVTQLTAGDTFNPAPTVTPAYPASAGWVLKYRLRHNTAGLGEITLVCAAAGDDHQPSAPAGTTAQWVPGAYSWASWVERGGESYSLESGQITVLPDPRTAAAGVDGRSQAERAVADCKAALATLGASGGRIKRYSIAGREVEFDTAGDALRLLNHWQAELTRERRAASIAAGLGNPARVRVRFV
jgi:enamine deaminase RidA (YjgF/YER057c/UK114 family)